MSIPTNPDLLAMPFAKDGDKNSIPETTSPTTGLFSQQYGFQNINSLPLTAGGKAVSRLDFNGAMYMLSNLLYYMQRGYTFVYDNTMPYVVGCQVLDPNDGQVYICTADAAAGTGAPSATPANWEMVPNATNLDLKVNPTFDNVITHKETFTSSGSFTAPVTGIYKITLQGGGGGGAGAAQGGSGRYSGGGGGAGAQIAFYEKLIAGTAYAYTVGAGGSGGTGGTSVLQSDSDVASAGSAGGASSITINNNAYIAGGGGGGFRAGWSAGYAGTGGTATKNGSTIPHLTAEGQNGFPLDQSLWSTVTNYYHNGGNGGHIDSSYGYGGSGGAYGLNSGTTTSNAGTAGGDGFITFEWLDTSLL